MTNRDFQIALDYHERTKHSPRSVRANRHYLDWANQPLPFKIYRDLEATPLPRAVHGPKRPLLSILDADLIEPRPGPISTQELARLLYFSAGITKRKKHPGGEIAFRAASCTGALYEIELYVVCGDLDGLAAGVYLYSPRDESLYRLRQGDYRSFLVAAAAKETRLSSMALAIISTGTYWRNAWKYQARTYRHFGWDNGTILANLLTMCNALQLPAHLLLGFQDPEINRLLDLDTDREVSLSMVAVGGVAHVADPHPRPSVEPLQLATIPLSEREVDYPEMREMHQCTFLNSGLEVQAWRSQSLIARPIPPAGQTVPLERKGVELLSSDPPERVILRRGSSRRFERKPISFRQFSSLLRLASRGLSADFLESMATLNDWYLIVHAVEDLLPGSYYFHRRSGDIELLRPGNFRNEAGHLGLGQQLPSDASFDVFFLADLDTLLARYGNRGYRAVQLEAGILGGKLYLAAYAQRLGATGLTFFDDDVVNFFSPHAAGKSAIFLMALGRISHTRS
ncbi:MAG: SagB/ThcOx family dehydrogenase [Acidobacteriota bacterium]